MDLMKNVPNVAWACLTVAFLAVVTAFVVLAVTGADAAEFRGFLNIVANFAGILVGGGGLVFAAAGANRAQKAVEQTNGSLDERIQRALGEALKDQRADDTAPGGEFRR